ncbi:MAG: hypothetical protein ACOVP4_02955 [Bacteriovoracaceae bacterium]|jgi:hypothetical protein
MKLITMMLLTLFTLSAFSFAEEFPQGPLAQNTPGELCTSTNHVRYPERIAYCDRDVSSARKKQIFEDYRRLGFTLPANDRGSYKIDHYIPLCAGGSNSTKNLWPQHKSVYEITDPLEPLVCEKMSQGRLKQAEAVDLVKKVKNDLSKADEVMDYLNRL